MEFTHKNKGTCSTAINFKIENGIVKDVTYTGGCNGNLKAVSRLVEGLAVEEVIRRCEGIKCGFKNTSCADQLAQALKEAISQAQK